VQNTGAADEKIFISGLADNNTDLTTTSTSIVGTTCGQSGNGQGTLSSVAGVPFPAAGLAAGTGTPPTSNGGVYNCQFDVLFCGAPTAGAEQFGTGTCDIGGTNKCTAGNVGAACTTNDGCDLTCTGISHSDQLSATLTGDDANPADTISPIVNKTTHVTECVSVSQVTE
jgi:hypothetical protein